MSEDIQIEQETSVETTTVPETTSAETTNTGGADAREFTDNDLVRVPWSKEPVKYGELYKRLQSDHTKKTTEAANLRRKYEADRNAWEQSRRSEESRLKQLATELLARQRGGGQLGQLDPYAAVEGMQFVDGKTVAKLLRDIQEGGFGSVQQGFAQRDAVIEGMFAQVKRLQQQLQQVGSTHANAGFESKIAGFLKNEGLPESYSQYAKELYMAYEGDDLDEQFPQILRDRIAGLRAMWESEQNSKIEAARRRPFPLPGKGGAATAGKKLNLTGRENAKQVSDVLWDAMQGRDDT